MIHRSHDSGVGELAPDLIRNRPIELVTIINSFNRRELLERAIKSLVHALRKASFGSAIIVFEAGSDDGSKEFLRSCCEENPDDNLTVVMSAGGRSSFSDGVNTACATALQRFPECQWLFLYETDNWLASVEPICRAISLLKTRPELAAAGFTVKRHSGIFCGYGMRFPSSISLALGLNLSMLWNLDSPNESVWQVTDGVRWRTCDAMFTSPLVIRREAWERTGGFDAESFPFSDSDLDWAWRCAKSGWKMAVIASEEVVHDNLEQPSAWSASRVIDFHRSRLRLLRRHRKNRARLLKPVLFLRHFVETILLACKAGSDPAAQRKLANRRQMLRTVWSDYSS
jgi:GT2 family glycosyltransferase